MNESGPRRTLPDQSSGSGHTFGTSRHPYITDLTPSKRVCFYKSGDAQFSGLRMVINNRTFKTFDALLDSLSKKVPLPFGVRNITTPRGVHAVHTLDELEDGKSYICSDHRKVKPINLALARKKLPPWYHARPVSARRQTVQLARFSPGGRATHKQEPVAVRTPKRLLVFRNGDPSVRHKVMLHKRTTSTFESLLSYISELMQFHVAKLHTPDGRRVDGLPALILCSGTVVAAGREPFRSANYIVQKSPAPTRFPTNRMGPRRLKALNRTKKSISSISKSRNFSPSSERYIVSRIQNSITESVCDLPSNLTDSVELDTGHILESVAETQGDTCVGDGAAVLPAEDDIEKSFRVNQDGSMTVEMRVRLTIKEEETVHWTTTLSRSSVANQLHTTCLPESQPEQESISPESNLLESQNPTASIDCTDRKKSKDDDDNDPPSLINGIAREIGSEEDNVKAKMDAVSPRRAPTPGPRRFRQKQASVESIRSVTAEEIQDGMVGSYSYREQKENGDVTEQYCMVQQSSTRPVPKPRGLGSVEANGRDRSTFKSAGMTEILQIEAGGEVTETVLHIYEQQTCQDNFLANSHFCAQGVSMSGFLYGRPATACFSSNNDFETEFGRPSTASESISLWRSESMSLTSDLTMPSLMSGAEYIPSHLINVQRQHIPEPTKGKDYFQLLSESSKEKPQKRAVSKAKRVHSKPKVIKKRVLGIMSPRKRQKESIAEVPKNHKKVKPFSSAGFIKRIYGHKQKSVKSAIKLKKKPTKNVGEDVTPQSSELSDDTIKSATEDPNISSPVKENKCKTVSFENNRLDVPPAEISQLRGILTRQESIHQERKSNKEPCDVGESTSLSAFNSSGSVTNEYVENWLEKAHLNTAVNPDEEIQKAEAVTSTSGSCTSEESEINCDVIIAAEKKTEIQTCPTLKTIPSPDCSLETKVKQRIKSFENKLASASPSREKTANTHTHPTITNRANCITSAQNNTEEINPLSNNDSSGTNPPTTKTWTEMPSDSEAEKPKVTRSNSLSMENASANAESPVEKTEQSNTEHRVMDASSVASGSLYSISSVSTLTSDSRPRSSSPTSDMAASPADHTLEKTAPIQTTTPSTLREAPLQRNPSVKKTRLVSNLSFERKMSLKKASLDKSALCSGASLETTISSTPVNTATENKLSNGVLSTRTQQPSDALPEKTPQSNRIFDLPSPTSSPSCYISASPTSLTSEERALSDSLSSNEAPTTPNTPFKASSHVSAQNGASSPEPRVKKVQLLSKLSEASSSPPLGYTSLTGDRCSKSASSHNLCLDKTTQSPNLGIRKIAVPNSCLSTERQLSQRRLSPYSRSLDVGSPPVRLKSDKRLLSRSLSSDIGSEPTDETRIRTPSRRKPHQTQVNKIDDLSKAAQEKSTTEAQIIPQPLNIASQPNIKPVLEKICYSIKSIRQMTQNKRQSCLEKSNSLPDFSSHLATTFGSSSKVLLAFLSVMTLKDRITNSNIHELDANNVSCAEALKMIDSLREIASIEESHNLKTSMSNLHKSTSKQLLQSWKSFQELSGKCKSRSSTPNHSERELLMEPVAVEDGDAEGNIIDELMNELDLPEKLKEELAALPGGKRAESDSEGKAMDLSLKENIDANFSHFSKGDVVKFRELAQNEKQNLSQGIHPDQETKDEDCEYEQNVLEETRMATCPLNGHNAGEHLHTVVSSGSIDDKGNREGMRSCREAVNEEYQGQEREQQLHDEDKSNLEKAHIAYMDLKDSTTNNLVKDRCSTEGQQPDVECKRLQVDSEESMSTPESELTPDYETCSDEEGYKEPRANKYAEQKVNGEESISDPGVEKKSRSEEERAEVECKKLQHLSNKDGSSNPTRQSNSKKRERLPANNCMRLNGISEENTSSLDVEEQSSPEEDRHEVGCKEQQVINEEGLSDTEKDHDGKEEEQDHPDDQQGRDEQMNKQARREEGENTPEEVLVRDRLGILIENQDSHTIKDNSSLIKQSNNMVKHGYGFDVDEDSGNDHRSCEEHADEAEQPKAADEQSSSMEDVFSYEKESGSEGEHATAERYVDESYAGHQETHAMGQPSEEVTKIEKPAEKLTHQSEEITSQSVAERLRLLEKQVAEAHQSKKATGSSRIRRFFKKDVRFVSDVEGSSSESNESQAGVCTRAAPQSSLSFSYDSSGVITTEPEGNRVRSIKELFLAKGVADIQYGQRRFPSPNTSELSDYRPETSDSGGYQSQMSSELSSVEDDSAQKSITKGFVRRTIERLYGKKDATADEAVSERPTPAPKQNKKEGLSIFSPFHAARSKVMSDLSYFNSTSALDTFSEATRCLAFNAQVGPGGSVQDDQERWLLRENTQIRKSVSDPVGINKTFEKPPQDEEMCTNDNVPYSLLSTKSELEEKAKSVSTKCTYFSLPHGSDSDVCQDDLSMVSKSSANGDGTAERTVDLEENNMRVKSSTLPAVSAADFKMLGNKVHPLIEAPPDAEVVVVQPGKGHGVVNRRRPEPDALDMLYTFCGEHCPIL